MPHKAVSPRNTNDAMSGMPSPQTPGESLTYANALKIARSLSGSSTKTIQRRAAPSEPLRLSLRSANRARLDLPHKARIRVRWAPPPITAGAADGAEPALAGPNGPNGPTPERSRTPSLAETPEMHGDRVLADEQGTRDPSVTSAVGEGGKHVGVAVGEADPGADRDGGCRAVSPRGQPRTPRQFPDQAEQGSGPELAGRGLASGQGTSRSPTLSSPGRGLRLPQAWVGLPARLASHSPRVSHRAPGGPVIGPVPTGVPGGR